MAAVVGTALSLASTASASPPRGAPAAFAAEAARVEHALPKLKQIETSLDHTGGEGGDGIASLDAHGGVRKMLLTLYGERGRWTETHYLDEAELPTLVLTRYERYHEQVGGDTRVVSTEWCRFRYIAGAAGEGTCIDDRGQKRTRSAENVTSTEREADLVAQFHKAVIADQIEGTAKRLGAELSVEIKVISIAATFSIRDMPEGYHRWHLTAEVIACQVGGCIEEPAGSRFEADVDLYYGPVRSRPLGLWVNDVSKAGSTWVAFFRTWNRSIKPLFAGKGEQALLMIARENLANP